MVEPTITTTEEETEFTDELTTEEEKAQKNILSFVAYKRNSFIKDIGVESCENFLEMYGEEKTWDAITAGVIFFLKRDITNNFPKKNSPIEDVKDFVEKAEICSKIERRKGFVCEPTTDGVSRFVLENLTDEQREELRSKL